MVKSTSRKIREVQNIVVKKIELKETCETFSSSSKHAETRDSHPSSGIVSTSVRVKNDVPFRIKEMAEIQIVKVQAKKETP